uniref:Endonuclease/exonuclease/phosphatase domain-containing protein n=1 Tax=Laticauda laticaudata TaxID=8630 RepID=A0A8C5SNH7_LATLA
MLFIGIILNQKKILLATVYVPNINQKQFYTKLQPKIIEIEYTSVCIVGDLNAVSDKDKDYRSSKIKIIIIKGFPSSFKNMLRELNLKDVWRELYPTKKQYILFSSPHHSCSTIDQIWMDPARQTPGHKSDTS